MESLLLPHAASWYIPFVHNCIYTGLVGSQPVAGAADAGGCEWRALLPPHAAAALTGAAANPWTQCRRSAEVCVLCVRVCCV